MAKTAVLELTTLTEREHVRINFVTGGKTESRTFELVNPGELSILDYHRLGKRVEMVQELTRKATDAPESMTDEDMKQLVGILDLVTRTILVADDEVHRRIGDHQRIAIIQTFTALQLARREPAGAEAVGAPADQLTGASRPAA